MGISGYVGDENNSDEEGQMIMKIIVLMGSPNHRGSTSILVEEFKRGAEESHHLVEVIDVCHADIKPCTGINRREKQ